MDFTTTLSNASKRTILTEAISTREEAIWSNAWHMGVDPDDLPSDYTAPAVDPLGIETQMEADIGVLNTLKAELAAIPGG
jgi:hypothetical protein